MAKLNPITIRLLAIGIIIAGFSMAWRHYNTITLLILGQPSTAGKLQREEEEPFFKNLASSTKLPIIATYHTADSYGLKDSHQLEAIRDGRLDIISLRFMQNSHRESGLDGIDLPGMNPDFKTARQVAKAYTPALDRYLQEAYGAKLLSTWSFGPQVMFCKQQISKLNDVQGRKIRVASSSLAQLIKSIGGVPVVIPFDETHNALQLGLVECAVSSAASAFHANWAAHTKYYFPLVFQFGFNGYVISKNKWNALSPDQRQRISGAFQIQSQKLWDYSEKQQKESENCLTGGPCLAQISNKLKRMPVSHKDLEQIQQISRDLVLPNWLRICEQAHAGCSQDWIRTIAPLTKLREQDASQK